MFGLRALRSSHTGVALLNRGKTQLLRTYATTKPVVEHQADEYILDANGKRPMVVHRELPDPFKAGRANRRNFVIFAVLVTASFYGIINYEKTNSPIINSTLHYLRRSTSARELLGNEISFRDYYPWIRGNLNQVQGKINIEFAVSGTLREGVMKLVANRENQRQEFRILKWVLCVEGEDHDLLEDNSVKIDLN